MFTVTAGKIGCRVPRKRMVLKLFPGSTLHGLAAGAEDISLNSDGEKRLDKNKNGAGEGVRSSFGQNEKLKCLEKESTNKQQSTYESHCAGLEPKTANDKEASNFPPSFEAKKYALFMQIQPVLESAPELVKLIDTWNLIPTAIRNGFLETAKAFRAER